MKKVNLILIASAIVSAIFIAQLLTSCNSSKDVVSSSSIQKRKYQKGYYANLFSTKKKADGKVENSTDKVAVTNQSKENNPDKIGTEATNEVVENSIREDVFATSEKAVPVVEKKKQFFPIKTVLAMQKAEKEKLQQKFTNKIMKRLSKALTPREEEGAGGSNKTLAILGMIFGILGCISYCAGPFFGLAGVICSAIALSKIKKDSATYGGKGMAVAGLICGIVAVVVWTAYFILYAAALSSI